jgi:anti-anti-sigma regulatory factor
MVLVTTARGWDFEVDRGPDWLFIVARPIEGHADGSPTLAEQVWGLLEQTLTHRLVIDLSQIDRLDEKLIEQLAWLNHRIHAQDGMMRICGLSPKDEALLREHDVEGHIAHYCDREAAVMGQDRPRQPR